MKFSIRGLMVLAVWVSIAGAAYAATMSIERPYTVIPVGVLWILVTLYIMAVAIGALVVHDHTRAFWIGCAVVAVGFVVSAASTNLTMYHTTVGQIAAALTDAENVTSDPNDIVRILRRESVRRIIDLSMIPVLSILGGYFGSYLSKTRSGNQNRD